MIFIFRVHTTLFNNIFTYDQGAWESSLICEGGALKSPERVAEICLLICFPWSQISYG